MISRMTAKFWTILASFTMMLIVISANSTCPFYHYQPKVPAGMKKYRRF